MPKKFPQRLQEAGFRSARKLNLEGLVQVGGAAASGVASSGEVLRAELGSVFANPSLETQAGQAQGSAVATPSPAARMDEDQLKKAVLKRVARRGIQCMKVAADIVRLGHLAPTLKQAREACWASHVENWESLYTGPDAKQRCEADALSICTAVRDGRRKQGAASDSIPLEEESAEEAECLSESSVLTGKLSESSELSTDLELQELLNAARPEAAAAGAWRSVATTPAQKTVAKAKAVA